jgi:hypothetical protein
MPPGKYSAAGMLERKAGKYIFFGLTPFHRSDIVRQETVAARRVLQHRFQLVKRVRLQFRLRTHIGTSVNYFAI